MRHGRSRRSGSLALVHGCRFSGEHEVVAFASPSSRSRDQSIGSTASRCVDRVRELAPRNSSLTVDGPAMRAAALDSFPVAQGDGNS